MSSNSNTSSVDAQNGSSYSRSHLDFFTEEAFADATYPTDFTNQVPYPAGAPYSHTPAIATEQTQERRAVANKHHYQNGQTVSPDDRNSYNNGDPSQSISNYHIFSYSDQQQPEWDDQKSTQECQHHRQYYLLATSYEDEIPNYDSEIVMDSVEDGQGSPQHSNQPAHGSVSTRSRSRQPSTSRHSKQTPQQPNVARSPIARKWSRDYSPEERMRVGLPRWETENDRVNYYVPQQREGRRRS